MKSRVRELTRDEAREMSWRRTQAWLSGKQSEPFTPEEARWHAREFIAHNTKRNLVRLLAEAFIALQDGGLAASAVSEPEPTGAHGYCPACDNGLACPGAQSTQTVDVRDAAEWTLVERYVENFPDDWRLVFRCNDKLLEISVPEETWRAFDTPAVSEGPVEASPEEAT